MTYLRLSAYHLLISAQYKERRTKSNFRVYWRDLSRVFAFDPRIKRYSRIPFCAL